jgi:hypothetical protein
VEFPHVIPQRSKGVIGLQACVQFFLFCCGNLAVQIGVDQFD